MKISIVIPVYNVVQYLPRCVDAILANDTRDTELILVDDGSADGSAALCDRYAAEHPALIRVVHRSNAGPGAARNAGIAAARGDWFLFVDSDDRLAPHALTRLREAAAAEDADVISFQFFTEPLSGAPTPRLSGSTPTGCAFSLAQRPDFLLSQPSCWLRLWHRSVFEDNRIAFPDVVWYEDVRTVVKLLAAARRIVNLPDRLYYYLNRPGSIMNNTQLPRNYEIMPAFTDILDWYRERGLFARYENELCALTVQHVLLAASVRVARIDPKAGLLRELREYTEQRFPDWRKNPYLKVMPLGKRLALTLVRLRRFRLLRLLFRLKG